MLRPVLLLVTGIVVLGIAIQQALALHRQTNPSEPAAQAHVSVTPLPIPTATIPPTPPVSRALTIGVDGLSYIFRPANVTVSVGTPLVWVNRTAAPHTVTSLASRDFNLTVPGWRRGTLTFLKRGTYRYFCSYHPYMLGVVTVLP